MVAAMLNNHYHHSKYLLIFCFFLSSCAPVQQIHSSATPTISPRPTEILQPLSPPTSSVAESTPTASIISVETQRLKEIAFSSCWAVNPEPPGGNQIPWLLLVQRAAVYSIEPNSGLKSDQLIPSPENTNPFAYDFALSPNGKWLAYELSGENDDSVVVEPSGNLLTKSSQGRIVWPSENLFQLHGWLSNESVVLRIFRSPDRFVSTLIRNPFNEEEHEFFLEEMPDYMDYQPGGISGVMLFANSNLMPDPTLKRVVYPAKNDYLMAALWDVENKKVLMSLRLFFDWAYNDPLWSLDGSDFVIMGIDEKEHEEWFQVTRDGAIKQLTHVGEFLKNARFGSSSRSPDGRYLAFTLWKEDSRYKRYLILDLKSQSLDGFCIDSGGKSNPYKP